MGENDCYFLEKTRSQAVVFFEIEKSSRTILLNEVGCTGGGVGGKGIEDANSLLSVKLPAATRAADRDVQEIAWFQSRREFWV